MPLYGESEDIGYIRNIMKIRLVEGDGNNEDMLGFYFNITSIEPTMIEV